MALGRILSVLAWAVVVAIIPVAAGGGQIAQAAEGKVAEGSKPPATVDERWKEVLEGKLPHAPVSPTPAAGGNGATRMAPPVPPDFVSTDPATREAYNAASREYYTYLRKGLEHRQRVFAWQYYSSIVIFVVVILLVASGIYFAAVQFHQGVLQGRPGAETATQLEAGTSGVKVSSPVLGVIILTLSLAFFWLYLRYVYPISEIF